MSDSKIIMYSLAFIFFLIFVVSVIASLIDRNVIRRKLKDAGFEKYEDYFPTRLTETSMATTWKILKLFVLGKREGIKSPELINQLKTHRRIEILAILSFFMAQLCFLLALMFSGELIAL